MSGVPLWKYKWLIFLQKLGAVLFFDAFLLVFFYMYTQLIFGETVSINLTQILMELDTIDFPTLGAGAADISKPVADILAVWAFVLVNVLGVTSMLITLAKAPPNVSTSSTGQAGDDDAAADGQSPAPHHTSPVETPSVRRDETETEETKQAPAANGDDDETNPSKTEQSRG